MGRPFCFGEWRCTTDALRGLSFDSSVTLDEGWRLLIDPDHPVRYGAHGCDPNLWHTDATTLVARRAIPAGAELPIDDATHTGVEGWGMDCRCGAKCCRAG